MDLSAAITIERPGQSALDINSVRDATAVGFAPLSGYSVESVDFSSVQITAFTEDSPQVDGSDSYDPYLTARTINMSVAIYGSTYGDFWDKLDALNYALQAQPRYSSGTALPTDGRRKLSFSQPTAAGTRSLYMLVRPVTLPRFVTDKAWASGDTNRGWATTVNVSLVAEDPYKYFASARTFTRSGSGTMTIVNDGTTIAWPVITWANPTSAVAQVSYTDPGTGANYTVNHTATVGPITDTFKTSQSTSFSTMTTYSFFSLPPGSSTLSMVGSGTITVTINEAIL